MKIQFKNFIELKRGFDLPTSKRIDGKHPIISANGISGYHNDYISNSIGVITGRSGTIGEVFLSTSPYWALNTTLYVSDFKGNNPEFVYYFLKWFNLSRFSSGAVVPTLNRNHLSDIEIDIPNFESQLRITNIVHNRSQI